MRAWLSVVAGALLMAFALHPWTVMGSQIAETTNPFPWPAMAVWMIGAAGVTRWLARRGRLVLTHVVVHLLTVAIGFSVWLGWQQGVPAWTSPALWWRSVVATLGHISLGTIGFWLLWWGFLWYRGVRLGEGKALREERAAEFALGFLGWGLCLLLLRSAHMPTAPLVPGLFAYFLIGLAAQALETERFKEDRGAPFSSRPSSLAPAVLLLALTGGASHRILSAATGSSTGVRTGVDMAAGFIGPKVTAFIEWWFGRPRGALDIPVEEGPSLAAVADGGIPGGLSALPMWMKWLMGIGGALLAAAALAAAVWAFFVLGRILLQRKGGEHWTAVGRAGIPRWRLWVRVVRRRVYRMRMSIRRLAAQARTAWQKGWELWFPLDVYALYRGYLWWGRLIGRPRQPGETPTEYGVRIAAEVPAAAPGAAALTEALTVALYGPGDIILGAGGDDAWLALRRQYRRLFHPRLMAAAWWSRFRRRENGQGR